MNLLNIFKPKNSAPRIVVRASAKEQRKDRRKFKETSIQLAKEIGDTQALARLNECWSVE